MPKSPLLLALISPIVLSQVSLTQSPREPSNFVPVTDEAAIILGQPCPNLYVVAIPASTAQILDRVQRLVPSAFLTNSQLGFYVQAGSFRDRSLAESLSYQLHYYGFNARVVYNSTPCQVLDR